MIVTELDDEVLVYHLSAHRAHCLTREAYSIFAACDGRATPSTLAASLGVDRVVVERALRALHEAHLVTQPRRRVDLSRRRAMKKLAVAVAVPMVWSIAAPSVAQAASTSCRTPSGCTASGQCCGISGHTAGTCTANPRGNGFHCAGGGSCSSNSCS